MSLSARPSEAREIFQRLSHWGEISVHEAEVLGAGHWLSAFEDARALVSVHDNRGRPVAWHLNAPFLHLLNLDDQQVGRRLCFAVPSYRGYLIGILAEGLLDAARAGMALELEQWTSNELAALLPEVNSFLDAQEQGGRRLVDLSPVDFDRRAAQFPGRGGDFATWDAFTLGHSARPKALFEFALRRFAPCSARPPLAHGPAAVLRRLPLNHDDGFSLSDVLLPCAWNTRRYGVRSGIAIVDADGRCILEDGRRSGDAMLELLRDALVEHPFYAAVLHLAICAWRSPASALPSVELYVPATGALHGASVLIGSRGAGQLVDLLGDLVRIQGFAPFGLSDGRVPNDLMENLLRNLLDLRMLRQHDELLVLDEDYRSSLMAARLRTVFRPGKFLQQQIVEELVSRIPSGSGS